MNTLVPEEKIPNHQGPDAQSVDPELDVITMAVMVPETLGHLYCWTIRLSRSVARDEVLEVFRKSPRISLIRAADGLGALNTVKELMLDIGRPHGNLYEVALWENLLEVRGDELFYAYMVDNQAIVIPETIDAIRALHGRVRVASESIRRTNEALCKNAIDDYLRVSISHDSIRDNLMFTHSIDSRSRVCSIGLSSSSGDFYANSECFCDDAFDSC